MMENKEPTEGEYNVVHLTGETMVIEFKHGVGTKIRIDVPVEAENDCVKHRFVGWKDGVKRPFRIFTWPPRRASITAIYEKIENDS